MNTKIKVTLAFIVIFATGMASGFLLSHLIEGEKIETVVERQVERQERQQFNQERMRERMTNYFELSEEQQDEFFEKFNAYNRSVRREMQGFREQEHSLMQERYSEFYKELEKILAEDQLESINRRMNPDSVRHNRRVMIRRN